MSEEYDIGDESSEEESSYDESEEEEEVVLPPWSIHRWRDTAPRPPAGLSRDLVLWLPPPGIYRTDQMLEHIGYAAALQFVRTGELPVHWKPYARPSDMRLSGVAMMVPFANERRSMQRRLEQPEDLLHYLRSIATHRHRLDTIVGRLFRGIRPHVLSQDLTTFYKMAAVSMYWYETSSIALNLGLQDNLTKTLHQGCYFRFNPVHSEGGMPAHYSLLLGFSVIQVGGAPRIAITIYNHVSLRQNIVLYCAETRYLPRIMAKRNYGRRERPYFIYFRSEAVDDETGDPLYEMAIPYTVEFTAYLIDNAVVSANSVEWYQTLVCTSFVNPWKPQTLYSRHDILDLASQIVELYPGRGRMLPISQANFAGYLYSLLMEDLAPEGVVVLLTKLFDTASMIDQELPPLARIPLLRGVTYTEGMFAGRRLVPNGPLVLPYEPAEDGEWIVAQDRIAEEYLPFEEDVESTDPDELVPDIVFLSSDESD